MKTLPDKPSELIRIAIADLKKVESMNKYTVDMGAWHDDDKMDSTCHVCMAGSVIACTLDKTGKEHWPNLSPYDFDLDTESKLRAINYLRMGSVGRAFDAIGLNYDEGNKYMRDICQYHNGAEIFYEDMEQLASDLEKDGY